MWYAHCLPFALSQALRWLWSRAALHPLLDDPQPQKHITLPHHAPYRPHRAMMVAELRALVAGKDQLVHLMTHELRTPILGILGTPAQK